MLTSADVCLPIVTTIMFWPPELAMEFQCPRGSGMCASVKLDIVIVAAFQAQQLYVFSLSDGTQLRILGQFSVSRAWYSQNTTVLCCRSIDSRQLWVAIVHARVYPLR